MWMGRKANSHKLYAVCLVEDFDDDVGDFDDGR